MLFSGVENREHVTVELNDLVVEIDRAGQRDLGGSGGIGFERDRPRSHPVRRQIVLIAFVLALEVDAGPGASPKDLRVGALGMADRGRLDARVGASSGRRGARSGRNVLC